MSKKSKQQTPMEKLTKGYENFMMGKKLNLKGKKLFEYVLQKAVNSKAKK